jgi:hypothetical protein
MIHVVVKCLTGLPLLIHIELLWRSRSSKNRGVGSFKNRGVRVGAFVYQHHSPDSDYATRWKERGSNPDTGKSFLFSLPPPAPPIRPARLAGPTKPPIEWVLGSLTGGQSCRGVKLTTRLHLMPRLRMSGVIHLLALYAFMAWTGRISSLRFTLCDMYLVFP